MSDSILLKRNEGVLVCTGSELALHAKPIARSDVACANGTADEVQSNRSGGGGGGDNASMDAARRSGELSKRDKKAAKKNRVCSVDDVALEFSARKSAPSKINKSKAVSKQEERRFVIPEN